MKGLSSSLPYGVLGLVFMLPARGLAEDWLPWPDQGQFAAYPAEAPGDRVHFKAWAGAIRDSNLFRLADGDPVLAVLGQDDRSDVIRRFGADLDADLQHSQQQLLFNANVTRNSFQDFDQLDHTAYSGLIDWHWKAGSAWSGTLGASGGRALASFAELQAPIKDLIAQEHAHFASAFQFLPSWRLRAGLEGARYEHSNDLRSVLDNRTATAVLGLDHLSRAQTFVGFQFQVMQGDYPNREVVATSLVDNDFREYEGSIVFGWPFSGRTRLDARVGYTDRRHDEVPERDFQGPTGRIALTYSMSPKTLLDLTGYREVSAVEDLDASYVIAAGAIAGLAWAPSTRAVFRAELRYEDRDLEGNPGFVLGLTPQRQDTTRAARIGAGYRPWDNFELTVDYETGRRTSNVALAEYDYNEIMANIALRF